MKTNNLYVVATPIGNMEDISQRALDILSSVDIIACEDTRTSSVLLKKYNINTKLISCHKFNEKESAERIIDIIKNKQQSVALISDAGTPLISDPGKILLKEIYDNNIKVIPIPGACAVSTFLSSIPRQDEFYTFSAFLPRGENTQKELFLKYKHEDLIFYETANRLLDSLKNLLKVRGNKTKIAIGRELTKVFEEIKIDYVENIIEYYKNNTLKGEIVGLIYKDEDTDNNNEILDKIKILKDLNFSNKDISAILSALYKENKNKIYKMLID